jgi:hypothetical protein
MSASRCYLEVRSEQQTGIGQRTETGRQIGHPDCGNRLRHLLLIGKRAGPNKRVQAVHAGRTSSRYYFWLEFVLIATVLLNRISNRNGAVRTRWCCPGEVGRASR